MNDNRDRKDEIVLIINEWYNVHTYGPAVRDIARILGLGLTSTFLIIDKMVEDGVLAWPVLEDGTRVSRALRVAQTSSCQQNTVDSRR